MERAERVFGHLQRPQSLTGCPTAASTRFQPDSDDDVVIVQALRTPLCKARRGGLKQALPDDLLQAVFQGLIKNLGLEPTLIEDICVGNVGQSGAGANTGRTAQFISNIPETVPLSSVNRMCSSGLQACATIYQSIKAGTIDMGIGAGVESMTFHRWALPMASC